MFIVLNLTVFLTNLKIAAEELFFELYSLVKEKKIDILLSILSLLHLIFLGIAGSFAAELGVINRENRCCSQRPLSR